MSSKSALITGITGQDGYYLTELLLEKGYDVHGISRSAHPGHPGMAPLVEKASRAGRSLHLYPGDLSQPGTLSDLLIRIDPDEVYNLAAQSRVNISFEAPEATFEANALGVLRLLETIRREKLRARLFQASSAELFGDPAERPQRESTPFRPLSPYASAKLYAHWIVRNYRESFGMHAGNGILFNHESPLRPETFVTRKITAALARMRAGSPEILRLGLLDVRRDWGFAKDYVEAMWLMLQRPEADDYIVATGESHSVREFVELAAEQGGFRILWEGTEVEEIGRDLHTGKILVAIDPRFFRPADSEGTCGDPGKAARQLGWSPKILFGQLVELMMRADLARAAA
ncbi:MAG: GDP-mannose 4,6-dehydratase [Fibrobacteres bacterium]|nr:GDP-mannose 4,6-dehydratase [Fibrobacterota bacterium]